MLLTIIPLWYITSPTYFITGSVCLLICPVYFPHRQAPTLLATTVCTLYLWICFCFVVFIHLLCFLDPIYKWNHMGFVFLCLSYSTSIVPSGLPKWLRRSRTCLPMQWDMWDVGSVPGWGRSPGEGHGDPLQCPSLRIPWTEESDGLQSTGSQSRTQLKQLSMHKHAIS